jgi:outer membrane lipoprotein-sorting protein
VIKDGLMTIKNEGKENKVAMESSPIFKQINNLMLSTVKGDLLLNKDFDSKVFENANSYKLELTPKQAQMKEFIAKIVIILDKKDFSVNSIRMIEPAGDDTFISFTNKRNNAALPKDIFVVR